MSNRPRMRGRDLIAWRRTWMLSQSQLADLLDVHADTLSRWESGESRIPGMLPLALETLAGQRKQLLKHLRAQRAQLRQQQQGRPELEELAAELERELSLT